MTDSSSGVGRRPVFSICIPLYNAESTIVETLDSIAAQTLSDFEVLVVDDCSTDNGPNIVARYPDPRIVLYRNDRNLGYAGNIARCFELARGTYVYLMGNDDVLSPVALAETRRAFMLDAQVALVTRPYYWFENSDLRNPVRFIPPLDPERTRVVSVDTDDAAFVAVLNSISQLSGLAFRRDAFVPDYHLECFTAHVYPFLQMWKEHKVAFLSDYVLAVRIASSQTRSLSQIYNPSPTQQWVDMFEQVFAGERYARQRKIGRALLASHVEGLVQVRCSAGYGPFVREAAILVRYWPLNLASPKFWAYVAFLGTFPARAARSIADRLKPYVTGARRRKITLAGIRAADVDPKRPIVTARAS